MPCTPRASDNSDGALSGRPVVSICRKMMDVNAENTDDSTENVDPGPQWKLETVTENSQEDPELVVGRLLQSVTEVQNDYQNLRRELTEVQALQRELSTRLRATLLQVHGKFDDLRERIAGAPPH